MRGKQPHTHAKAVFDPSRVLAAAILAQACKDWRLYLQWRREPSMPRPKPLHTAWAMAREKQLDNPGQELLYFFHSPWCSLLCDSLGYTIEALWKANNIPPLDDIGMFNGETDVPSVGGNDAVLDALEKLDELLDAEANDTDVPTF